MQAKFWTDDDSFFKSYTGYTSREWRRFSRIAVDFSRNKISPELLGYDNVKKIMEWRKVIPLDNENPERMKALFEENGISLREAKDGIRIKVARMRECGYVHGDLHINNIGFANGEFYILDIDTVVIEDRERNVPWLIDFMEGDLDIKDFDEYAERDWTEWVGDLEDFFLE